MQTQEQLHKYIDAEKLLISMRKGELLLTGDIHYISFDDKISSDDLMELEKYCAGLGYFYSNVEIHRVGKKCFFIYPMKKR